MGNADTYVACFSVTSVSPESMSPFIEVSEDATASTVLRRHGTNLNQRCFIPCNDKPQREVGTPKVGGKPANIPNEMDSELPMNPRSIKKMSM